MEGMERQLDVGASLTAAARTQQQLPWQRRSLVLSLLGGRDQCFDVVSLSVFSFSFGMEMVMIRNCSSVGSAYS